MGLTAGLDLGELAEHLVHLQLLRRQRPRPALCNARHLHPPPLHLLPHGPRPTREEGVGGGGGGEAEEDGLEQEAHGQSVALIERVTEVLPVTGPTNSYWALQCVSFGQSPVGIRRARSQGTATQINCLPPDTSKNVLDDARRKDKRTCIQAIHASLLLREDNWKPVGTRAQIGSMRRACRP